MSSQFGKLPLPMTSEMFDNFDDSNIRLVWTVLREMAAPHLTGVLCPIPFIDVANYFDILNVFVEMNEGFLEKTKSLLMGRKRYKYVAKLKDVINFMTSNPIKLREMVNVTQHRVYNFGPSFERVIEGHKNDVTKMYFMRAESPKAFMMNLHLDPRIGVGVDRLYPGLEHAKRLLVISEVCAAEVVYIRTMNGGANDIKEWSYRGPCPLAFGATRLKLNAQGVILSQHPVPYNLLFNQDNWFPPDAPHPAKCPVLTTAFQGKFYDINKHVPKESDSERITIKPKKNGHSKLKK